jgi:hypothetical protein
MLDAERNELLFEEQCWKLQLEASRLALLMDEMRRDKLVMNLTGKYREWLVVLENSVATLDHGDDERRSNHGH